MQTIRVKVPEGAAGETDLVMLNATGYVMAAHKIELASKVVGRVAWVGVEMGDKIEKGQELVRLEDDEFRARVAQQQGLLDNAKAYLAELQAGSRPQEIAAAVARVDQAQAELANAEANYQRLKGLDATKDARWRRCGNSLSWSKPARARSRFKRSSQPFDSSRAAWRWPRST